MFILLPSYIDRIKKEAGGVCAPGLFIQFLLDLALIQPVQIRFKRWGDGGDGARFKGALEAALGGQLLKGDTARFHAERQVALPRGGVILHIPYEVLQGADLAQGVIQVIEGIEVDVQLLLPAAALLQELQAVIVQVGQVFLFDL